MTFCIFEGVACVVCKGLTLWGGKLFERLSFLGVSWCPEVGGKPIMHDEGVF